MLFSIGCFWFGVKSIIISHFSILLGIMSCIRDWWRNGSKKCKRWCWKAYWRKWKCPTTIIGWSNVWRGCRNGQAKWFKPCLSWFGQKRLTESYILFHLFEHHYPSLLFSSLIHIQYSFSNWWKYARNQSISSLFPLYLHFHFSPKKPFNRML